MIFDEDLEAIVGDEMSSTKMVKVYELEHIQTNSGTNIIPTATITLRKDKELITDSAIGDGPVDATCKAIERITGIQGRLLAYNIRSVSLGKDAVGEVTLRIRVGDDVFAGKGHSTDVIEASAKAWLSAVNRKLSSS